MAKAIYFSITGQRRQEIRLIAVGKYLALTKKKMSMFQRTRKKEGFFHNIGTLYDDREFQQFLYLHNSHSSLGDSAYSGRWEGIN